MPYWKHKIKNSIFARTIISLVPNKYVPTVPMSEGFSLDDKKRRLYP